MLSRKRARRITVLGLPIVGAMVSQNILNLVDTAMVGVLGPAQLAAVGVGSFANFMAAAMVIGLSSGVQAMASRRKGEGRGDEMAVSLNGGLFLALLIGLPLSVVLFLLAPVLFPMINGDPAVIADGVPYLQMRLMGVVAIGMNFSYRGYWNGVSRSGLYLRTLVTMHASNVVLNYVLIFGKLGLPAMGAEGAGLGTTLSLFLGTAIYTGFALRYAKPHGFLHRLPRRETMATLLRLAVPSAIQQFLFAAGFTVFFWIVGQVGTDEVAVSNVMVNLLLVAILPGMAIGMAALTLVGEALGRVEPEDAKQWGWDAAKVAMLALGTIGAVGLLFPGVILSGFIHDEAIIALGRLPVQLIGATMVFEGAGLVLLNALLGAGAARQVMIVSIGTQWLVGLPLAWLVGPYLGFGLLAVWAANSAYRILQTAIFVEMWRRGHWAAIKL